MALLESLDLPMGTPMPAFQLPDPDEKEHSSQKLSGPKGLLVAFTCNHCPYAIAIWPQLISLAAEAQKVAGVFKAQCTPDLYLFDAKQKLVYHGRLDELKEAISHLASGKPIEGTQ